MDSRSKAFPISDSRDIDGALNVARSAIANRACDAALAWRAVATFAPTDPAICEEIAEKLNGFGYQCEADTFLYNARERLPHAIGLAIAYARNAWIIGDTVQEIERWADVRARFPDQIHGYLGGSRTLRRLQRQQEAETILQDAIERFGFDRRLLVDLAASVTSRSDWVAAHRWWGEVERRGWLDGEGYAGLGTAQLRAGYIETAQATFEKGLGTYPDSPEIAMGFAEMLTEREDWRGAIRVWEGLVARFPNNSRYANGLGVAKWRFKTYDADHGSVVKRDFHLDRPADVGIIEDASARDLLQNFESLGQDCEFGLVQRHFGVEPLGLLRWTTTKPDTLIAGLRHRFAGLGDLENTVLDLSKPEIMVNDLALHIRFHTFIQHGITLDLDRFRKKQARHLNYLKQVFIERLENADRIYIYKYIGDVDVKKIDTMFEELRRFGPVSLLVIGRTSTDKAGGMVERVREGLYFGHLSRFGLDDGGTAWNIAFTEWIDLCRNASNLITGSNFSL